MTGSDCTRKLKFESQSQSKHCLFFTIVTGSACLQPNTSGACLSILVLILKPLLITYFDMLFLQNSFFIQEKKKNTSHMLHLKSSSRTSLCLRKIVLHFDLIRNCLINKYVNKITNLTTHSMPAVSTWQFSSAQQTHFSWFNYRDVCSRLKFNVDSYSEEHF